MIESQQKVKFQGWRHDEALVGVKPRFLKGIFRGSEKWFKVARVEFKAAPSYFIRTSPIYFKLVKTLLFPLLWIMIKHGGLIAFNTLVTLFSLNILNIKRIKKWYLCLSISTKITGPGPRAVITTSQCMVWQGSSTWLSPSL